MNNLNTGKNPYAKLRETYANAGRGWKKTEDEDLRRLFSAGNSIDDLTVILGRTPNAVRLRLLKLGLLREPAAAA